MRVRSGSWVLFAVVVQAACASHAGDQLASSMPDATAAVTTQSATATDGRRIIPRDLLQVTVFEAPELSGAMRVSENGEISMPLLGVVRVAGSTMRETERVLADRLRATYMRDPHVTVEVKEEAPQPVYVLGEVNQPGAFSAIGQEPMTILRAVSIARGFKPTAAFRRTVVIRNTSNGQRLQLPVDLEDVLRGRTSDMVLLANDVVYVPKNTERAIALGVVDALLRVVTFRTVF